MKIPRKARESALRMLFQWELSKEAPDRVKEIYWKEAKAEEHIRGAADPLFDGVIGKVEQIDRTVAARAEHWRIERMSAVDRNILRLGVFELQSGTVPPKTAITEAMDLAHRYSGVESARFVNGVLDAIRREREGDSTSEE